ncbi:MAG TPA: hypothetical protein VLK65_15430 [Vicinamibacteria bacterium]|nr:hypothetical protein [Vicinamibacteria bacterium]
MSKWMAQSVMFCSLVFIVMLLSFAASSQEPTLPGIMQRKLDHAHALLEGIIMEDFESLEESSRALLALSEEAGWLVTQSSQYTERSAAFRRAVSQLESAAKERNTEGAALGYVDMTLKCVQCHQYLRRTERADQGLFSPRDTGADSGLAR